MTDLLGLDRSPSDRFRAVGIGVGNGPQDRDFLTRHPIPLLMLQSEYVHADMKQLYKRGSENPDDWALCLFRAMVGPPADYGLDADAYASAVLTSLPGSARHVVFGNEWNLGPEWTSAERWGDDEGARRDTDLEHVKRVTRQKADFSLAVYRRLKSARPELIVHWGAWSPDHHEFHPEVLPLWRDQAAKHDVIDFHAYHEPENFDRLYWSYRNAFPDRPLWCTELSAQGRSTDWARGLVQQAIDHCAFDPDLVVMGFINVWYWWRDGQQVRAGTGEDIQDEPLRSIYNAAIDRLAHAQPKPEPKPEPEPEPMPDFRALARSHAAGAGLDPDIFERQIDQESGFNPGAYNAGSGASGIAQIIPRFHPTVDPWDPDAALRYAATWMAKLVRDNGGSYARALASYNWGPGNVGGYTKPDGTVVPRWDGRRATLPTETRLYLDRILGAGWETGTAPPPPPPPATSGYVFPVKGYTKRVTTHWETAPDNGHRGASDIFADKGTPVLVMRGGRVSYVGNDPLGGHNVVVDGDDGLTYYYAHGDRPAAVSRGQAVATGAFLFGVGDTGNAAGKGYHLHVGGGYGIYEGSGPAGGAGLNYDFVGLLRRVQAGGGQEDDDLMYKEQAEALTVAVCEMGDTVADAIELERSKLDDYGDPPKLPGPKALKAEWVAYGRAMDAWRERVRANTDERYQSIGAAGQRLRDIRTQFAGPR